MQEEPMPQSPYDTLPELSSQLHALIQAGWEQEIISQLPADYEPQARLRGAFVRARGLRCVGDLLRGLLAYVLCAPSFRQLGAWAVLIGLANLSHVAWQKQLRKARSFLLWLLIQCLAIPTRPASVAMKRVVLIDATRLKEPGGKGDDWRVHLGYDLLAGRLLDVKVSDGHTAEGFTLFVLQADDLVVADRGYCRRKQLAYVLQAGAQLVVRLAVHQVPLLDGHGEPFDVLAWLRQQGSGQHSCPVAFEYEGCRFAGRLLACSLPAEAAERARTKERKKAAKQQRQLKGETLYLCGWLVLFTTLSPEQWSDAQVLALYRARWQVELVIKRMKQQLKLAQLRGQSALTNEATLLAVLLAWALLQSEVQDARAVLTQAAEQWVCSLDALAPAEPQEPQKPAGVSKPDAAPSLPTVSSWSVTALCGQTLRLLVQGYWTFARLRSCLPYLHRFLTSRRRQRDHQESTIRRHLLAHLGLLASDSSLFFCSSA
jgi:Transposase DDE domain